ncbi:MAG TPA: hypothetical protein VKD69_02145 [Vicinamibacterales bacterium]|nr:hypothetical protein [Vicinamibacterales bacterium]
MTRYTQEEEEQIRNQAHVRAWARAGLIQADQATALEARLRTTLRRTNGFLRAALALFTAVIVAATVLLFLVSFDIPYDPATMALAIAAAAAAVIADYLVHAFRLYRYGIEEALAAAAVVLLAIAVDRVAHTLQLPDPHVLATLAASAGAFVVYLRFGFVYAAVAAMIGVAVAPAGLQLPGEAQSAMAAAACGVVFWWTRTLHRRHRDDFPGDDYALLQSAAFAGIYIALNLRLFDSFGGTSPYETGRWFYWATYVVTWLLPAAGLAMAIRDKQRPLLAAALAATLATLYTNKLYLEWPRQTWDPILLGVLLIGVATALRRWLASGPDGQRYGFTAARILEGDRDALATIATASAVWPRQPLHAQAPAEQPASPFEGGRSGGGGGGAAY